VSDPERRPLSDVASTAVVTGAGAGIGRAIASRLARTGAPVAVVDLDEVAARETVSLIESNGFTAAAFAADVADPSAPERLREQITRDLGLVRILVNNAGWSKAEPFLENSPELWERLIAVNLLGAIRVTHSFLSGMVAAGTQGRIVNVSSDAGRVGSSGEVVYSAAKGGLIAFTKALARESARSKVTVNCVCPGPTDTALLAGQTESFRDAVIRAIPMRRLAQPADIAEAVAFFTLVEAAYVTGQVVSVSGGLTMSG
jgi:2-hydroxycyclohexanecarboxyl-CoA dehydrogenase